jgi:hypothetical protein
MLGSSVPFAERRTLVSLVLAHEPRRVVHFNVTEHPTADWTSQRIVEAFGDGKLPRFLIRDRDAVYGLTFRERVKALGMEEVVIAPHSPWQTPYVERVIGALRRECIDHVLDSHRTTSWRSTGPCQARSRASGVSFFRPTFVKLFSNSSQNRRF